MSKGTVIYFVYIIGSNILFSFIRIFIFKFESDGFNKIKNTQKYNKLNILVLLYLILSYLSFIILIGFESLLVYLSLLIPQNCFKIYA